MKELTEADMRSANLAGKSDTGSTVSQLFLLLAKPIERRQQLAMYSSLRHTVVLCKDLPPSHKDLELRGTAVGNI